MVLDQKSYDEGWVAYKSGHDICSRPYDVILDHQKAMWWLSGYQAAKRVLG